MKIIRLFKLNYFLAVKLIVVVLILLTLANAYTNSETSLVSLNTTNGSITDFRNLSGAELLANLEILPAGSTVALTFKHQPEHQLWTGNNESGQIYSIIELNEIETPFLVRLANTLSFDDLNVLKDNVYKNETLYFVVNRISSNQTNVAAADQKLDSESQIKDYDKLSNLLKFYQNRFNVDLAKSVYFQAVTFSQQSEGSKVVIENVDSYFIHFASLFLAIFMIYFILAMVRYKYSGKCQRGANFLEMTFLLALIAVIGIASVTRLGDEIRCPLYNVGIDASGVVAYKDADNTQTKKVATVCCLEKGYDVDCLIDTCYCQIGGKAGK